MCLAASNTARSPSWIRPVSGVSRPAMERRMVVLPLPEWPSRAITSPRASASDTPFNTSLPPSRLWIPSTTSSGMQTHSQAQRHEEAGADQEDVDDRQGRDEIERPRPPEGDDERPDHLRVRAQQVDPRRVLATEDHEDQQPAPDEPEAGQWERHVLVDPPLAGADDARRLLQFGADLIERRRDQSQAVGEPDDRVGQPQAEQRAAERGQRPVGE